MAGGGVVVQGGRQYEGGVTAFVIVTCLVAAMGGLLFGYDLGISGLFFRFIYECIYGFVLFFLMR